MKNRVIAVSATVLAVLLTAIVLQNTEVVTYRVLFWHVSMSRILVVPIALLVGVGLGFVWGHGAGRRREKGAA